MTAKPQSKKKTVEIIRRFNQYKELLEQRNTYSLKSIADRHAIVSSTVNKLVKGWESSSLSDEVVANIRAEHKEGLRIAGMMELMQPSAIARDLRVSQKTVRNVYAKHVRDNKPVRTKVVDQFHRMYTQPISASPGAANPTWYY